MRYRPNTIVDKVMYNVVQSWSGGQAHIRGLLGPAGSRDRKRPGAVEALGARAAVD